MRACMYPRSLSNGVLEIVCVFITCEAEVYHIRIADMKENDIDISILCFDWPSCKHSNPKETIEMYFICALYLSVFTVADS